MADKLFVDVEGLRTSAVQVQGHSDGLSASQTTAGRRVSSASGGWTGQSARSLSQFADKLKAQSAALVNRLDDHSQQMHCAAGTFKTSEGRRAQELAQVYRGIEA